MASENRLEFTSSEDFPSEQHRSRVAEAAMTTTGLTATEAAAGLGNDIQPLTPPADGPDTQ